MAIEQFLFDRLRFHSGEILCLGYPDLLLTEDLNAPEAKDADAIRRWHGWRGRVYDTDIVFRALGLRPTYIDIHPSRGCERVVDLNQPLPADLVGRFDLVLDPGTLEHCFNIGQAFLNCALAAEVSIHCNPLNQANHGFWNISPTAYRDFYREAELSVVSGTKDRRTIHRLDNPFERFEAPENSMVMAVCRGGATDYPTQRKYRQNPDLKA